MTYTKLTITFPSDLANKVRQCIPRRQVSSFLATAAREKLSRDEAGRLHEVLARGYAAAAAEDRALAREWDVAAGDGL